MDEHEQQRSRFERPRPVADAEPRPSSIQHECVELCPICRSADVLRASLPPEFHDHWQAVQREAVLALRAALDHYIAHLDTDPKHDDPSVEDIPIE